MGEWFVGLVWSLESSSQKLASDSLALLDSSSSLSRGSGVVVVGNIVADAATAIVTAIATAIATANADVDVLGDCR